jgi:hypothetical protein
MKKIEKEEFFVCQLKFALKNAMLCVVFLHI